jgi:hypothetical protein
LLVGRHCPVLYCLVFPEPLNELGESHDASRAACARDECWLLPELRREKIYFALTLCVDLRA